MSSRQSPPYKFCQSRSKVTGNEVIYFHRTTHFLKVTGKFYSKGRTTIHFEDAYLN